MSAIMKRNRRIIIGISGASGIAYGIALLAALKKSDIETHLIVSDSAKVTMAYEASLKFTELKALADVAHSNSDIAACISSGSFQTIGMIIAPCSMKSLAEIANGTTTTLLSRAADVILKERRRLVLLARETPLSLVHIRNMQLATEAGAIIYPPVPAFYSQPKTIADIVDHTVGRVLDLFDIEVSSLKRWGETVGKTPRK